MKTVLKTVIVILCILLIYASAWKYIFPSSYQMYPDGYYATNEDTTTVQNEYMPIWVQKIPVESPKTPAEIVKGNGSLTSIMTNNPNKLQFTATLDSPSIVRVNTIYFPGWNMLANNKQQQISYNNEQGVIDVHLNPGNYHVVAKFGETPLRLFADILSLISVLLIIIIPMLVYVRRLSVTKPVS